jgi:uncharacterized CHY-type Zn-finger protein
MPDHVFPCGSCGAQLRFAPGETVLACPNCGHVQEISGADAEEEAEALGEIDYSAVVAGLERGATFEEHRTLACPNCGAQTEFSEGVQATTCPFCATPLVTEAAAHRQIRPTALIPFALDERAARAAMLDWLGSLWLAPSGLRDAARSRRPDGVYVPFWTFDARTETTYSGQRGDTYTVSRTVTRNGKPTRVSETRIRWRGVRGRVARAFNDVLVLASTSLPKSHTDALEPWDLQALTPYRPDFLAGFAAEGYHVGLEDGFTEARAVMDRVIEEDIRADIGGDHQRITRKHPVITEVTFKHVLLPVWMSAYRHGGRSFRVVVNGQTGRVQGERPWSKVKVALLILALLVLAIGGATAYQWAVANGYVSN